MHKAQRRVQVIVLGLLCLFALFPPWRHEYAGLSAAALAGHHFILTPPALKSYQELFGIDYSGQGVVRVDRCQLIAEVFSVLMCGLGLFILYASNKTFFKIFVGVTFLFTGVLVTAFTIGIFYYAGKTCI